MEAVFGEQFGARLAVRAEHRLVNVVKRDVAPFLCPGADQVVRLLHLGRQRPPFQARLDGDETDRRLGGHRLGLGDEGLEILEHPFGAFAGGDVVVSGVKHYFSRTMRRDETIEISDGIGDMRAAKAAIDRWNIREIRFQSFPQADAGASDEQDRAFGRGRLTIGVLERPNRFLPPFLVFVTESVGRKNEQQLRENRESGQQSWGHVLTQTEKALCGKFKTGQGQG